MPNFWEAFYLCKCSAQSAKDWQRVQNGLWNCLQFSNYLPENIFNHLKLLVDPSLFFLCVWHWNVEAVWTCIGNGYKWTRTRTWNGQIWTRAWSNIINLPWGIKWSKARTRTWSAKTVQAGAGIWARAFQNWSRTWRSLRSINDFNPAWRSSKKGDTWFCFNFTCVSWNNTQILKQS